MGEPDRDGISARLWRLPGQLLLALIDATAILVIVAAIFALVATSRIDHFAENVVSTMTEAVLSKVDLPPRTVLANLQDLTAEVRTLGNALREIKAGENPALQLEIAQLKEVLTALSVSIDRLRNSRSILTDEAIGQLGRTVTDALMKLRHCSSRVDQIKLLQDDHNRKNSNSKVLGHRELGKKPTNLPGTWSMSKITDATFHRSTSSGGGFAKAALDQPAPAGDRQRPNRA
jgi:hypothetical protein